MKKKILIISGEASGEKLVRDLIHKIQKYSNDIEYWAVANKNLEEQGVNILFNSESFCVTGMDILSKLPLLYKAYRVVAHFIKQQKIDLVILVDFPESDRLRCSLCNNLLKEINKKLILDKLAEGTKNNYDEFWICPNCNQIYWKGAHWLKMKKSLEYCKELINKNKL